MRQFVGPISLGLGFLLTFFGSKFLMYTLSLLVFLGVFCVIFVLAINFHVVSLDTGNSAVAMMIVTIIVGIVLGVLAAYLLYKFAKSHAVAILAAWAGATITMMVLSPVKMPNLAKLGIIIVVIGLAIWIGYKYKRKIRVMCTAIIGSGMLMFGIGSYLGGFPSMFRLTMKDVKGLNNVNASYLGYFAGFILCSVLGTLFQLRYIDQRAVDFFNKEIDE